MNANKKRGSGFTLIELMIVIAIIGILASVAIPAYQTYVKKARFTEVVMGAAMVKSAIDVCYAIRGAGVLSNCDTEAEIGVYLSDAEDAPMVDTVVLEVNTAMITATGVAAVDGETFILKPVQAGREINWEQSGTCIAAGLC